MKRDCDILLCTLLLKTRAYIGKENLILIAYPCVHQAYTSLFHVIILIRKSFENTVKHPQS